MYQPDHFRADDVAQMHALMRARPFATLVSAGSLGLFASHLPTVLKEEGPYGIIECHLARPNPHCQDLAGGEALMIFQGAQGYITPNWYPAKAEHGKVVPTWNYAVVHLYGRPQVMDDKQWLRRHVTELTAQQESGESKPWALSDAPDSYIEVMLRGIVGFRELEARIPARHSRLKRCGGVGRPGERHTARRSDPRLNGRRTCCSRIGITEGITSSSTCENIRAGRTERTMSRDVFGKRRRLDVALPQTTIKRLRSFAWTSPRSNRRSGVESVYSTDRATRIVVALALPAGDTRIKNRVRERKEQHHVVVERMAVLFRNILSKDELRKQIPVTRRGDRSRTIRPIFRNHFTRIVETCTQTQRSIHLSSKI